MKLNSELEVLRQLNNDCTLSDLSEQLAIKVKWSKVNACLVHLKYDQIRSPMSDTIVQECRGLILEAKAYNTSDDPTDFSARLKYRVVARGFDKFFNHGEGHAAPIDWPSALVTEKLDGSLCMLYCYNGTWHVATSGDPDASGTVSPDYMGGLGTFAELFWETFRHENYKLPQTHHEGSTFIFELTTKYNRIVVPQPTAQLRLIGFRNGAGKEGDPGAFRHMFRVVDSGANWHNYTLENIQAQFDWLDPLYNEGFVVVDKDFNRIKVKHPGYVAIHRLKGEGSSPSKTRFLDIVRTGEGTELLAHFPEWTDEYNQVQEAFNNLCINLLAFYQHIQCIPSRKDFALEACKTKCPGALFALRDDKVFSVHEYLATMDLKSLARILGFRE